jgi:hypothetical protein
MPGNENYYTSDPLTTPSNIKLKFKKKFEPKLMLYIVISENGISKPYFKPSGLAINQETYEKECLVKILIPFIKKYHFKDNYIFWPDKAPAHYSKKSIEFFNNNNIPFIPKDHNPTNLPQCHPIEDFFGILSQKVYQKGWKAKNIHQLQNRVKKCLKEVDLKDIQASFHSIKTKLQKCADKGPYSLVH